MIIIIRCFVILLILFDSDISGKVIGISDGDTIKILVGTSQIKVRLNGIDCPESNQDFGQKAKKFTSDFCFEKNVRVVSFGEDLYGRTLGDVYLEDGRCLNKELVKAGLAWHFKKYSKDTTLANLEIDARESKIGLWIQPSPIAPWDFRKNR